MPEDRSAAAYHPAMRILLVNDDGIHAPGIQALRTAAADAGHHVDVVAPLIEQSGVGHAITYRSPLQIHEWHQDGRFYGWQVDGTPADCVKLGVMELCEERPDLILSGVNAGANVGLNVFYSGTAAGCLEGAMFGIPSFAVSVYLNKGVSTNFPRIAADAVRLIEQLREARPSQAAWNINFPATEGPPKGVKVVPMQWLREHEHVERREDPRGRPYFWVGLHPLKNHPVTPGFDVGEIAEEYVAVTPLTLDLTCGDAMQSLAGRQFTL